MYFGIRKGGLVSLFSYEDFNLKRCDDSFINLSKNKQAAPQLSPSPQLSKPQGGGLNPPARAGSGQELFQKVNAGRAAREEV